MGQLQEALGSLSMGGGDQTVFSPWGGLEGVDPLTSGDLHLTSVTSNDSHNFLDLQSDVSSPVNEVLMNSMKLVIPLHSLYWSIHTKDESKRETAFTFIFGVN